MTMQSATECPQVKQGKNGEGRPCGKKRLYRVVEEEGAVGPYWTISLGTPANPPELCKACATLDAMARNRTAQIQRDMRTSRALQAEAEARQGAQEPQEAAAAPERVNAPDEAEAAAWEAARRGDEESGP